VCRNGVSYSPYSAYSACHTVCRKSIKDYNWRQSKAGDLSCRQLCQDLGFHPFGES
jgi:hypothetical protein